MRASFFFSLLSLFYTGSIFGQTIPNFPCYRTVESTYAAAEAIVDQYPHLAEWIDIGDSWEKTAEEGGHDLMVLKLTNKAITGDKPRLFVTSAIHAREFATAELMTRFVENLVAQYGTDPDITWALDHHEAHFLLVFNPDGRKKAEPNVMWRKNTNRNYCGRTSRNRGVDLNRNFDYFWGSAGSSNQCGETYRGPSAASEPETQAVQDYMRSLFVDRRGPSRDDVAPMDTSGVYIDIHSYGEIIYQSRNTPNDREITSMNRKLAFFNGYRPVLTAEQHPLSHGHYSFEKSEPHMLNHTFDFGYGDLGIASYLIELGTEFFQSCSYFENDILPKNFGALRYALKSARTPYMSAKGPDAYNVKVTSQSDGKVLLEASISDERYGTRSGREPVQNIGEVKYWVNKTPWDHPGEGVSMLATDGGYDNPTETVSSVIDPEALGQGRHTVFVQGKDSEGNWGLSSSVFLTIP